MYKTRVMCRPTLYLSNQEMGVKKKADKISLFKIGQIAQNLELRANNR